MRRGPRSDSSPESHHESSTTPAISPAAASATSVKPPWNRKLELGSTTSVKPTIHASPATAAPRRTATGTRASAPGRVGQGEPGADEQRVHAGIRAAEDLDPAPVAGPQRDADHDRRDDPKRDDRPQQLRPTTDHEEHAGPHQVELLLHRQRPQVPEAEEQPAAQLVRPVAEVQDDEEQALRLVAPRDREVGRHHPHDVADEEEGEGGQEAGGVPAVEPGQRQPAGEVRPPRAAAG